MCVCVIFVLDWRKGGESWYCAARFTIIIPPLDVLGDTHPECAHKGGGGVSHIPRVV
jgi:hypothetical protein